MSVRILRARAQLALGDKETPLAHRVSGVLPFVGYRAHGISICRGPSARQAAGLTSMPEGGVPWDGGVEPASGLLSGRGAATTLLALSRGKFGQPKGRSSRSRVPPVNREVVPIKREIVPVKREIVSAHSGFVPSDHDVVPVQRDVHRLARSMHEPLLSRVARLQLGRILAGQDAARSQTAARWNLAGTAVVRRPMLVVGSLQEGAISRVTSRSLELRGGLP